MRRAVAEPPPGALGPDADPASVARTIVLRRLAAAPRTAHELSSDLLGRGVPADVVGRVIARFIEVGLIDDAEYARMWVASRHRTRGSAPAVLRQELRRKGVADELIEQAVAELGAEEQRERAVRLVEQRLPRLERLEPLARQRRLVSMLQRRGYSSGLAVQVVREAVRGVALDDAGS